MQNAVLKNSIKMLNDLRKQKQCRDFLEIKFIMKSKEKLRSKSNSNLKPQKKLIFTRLLRVKQAKTNKNSTIDTTRSSKKDLNNTPKPKKVLPKIVMPNFRLANSDKKHKKHSSSVVKTEEFFTTNKEIPLSFDDDFNPHQQSKKNNIRSRPMEEIFDKSIFEPKTDRVPNDIIDTVQDIELNGVLTRVKTSLTRKHDASNSEKLEDFEDRGNYAKLSQIEARKKNTQTKKSYVLLPALRHSSRNKHNYDEKDCCIENSKRMKEKNDENLKSFQRESLKKFYDEVFYTHKQAIDLTNIINITLHKNRFKLNAELDENEKTFKYSQVDD